jgi:hypothetical protein
LKSVKLTLWSLNSRLGPHRGGVEAHPVIHRLSWGHFMMVEAYLGSLWNVKSKLSLSSSCSPWWRGVNGAHYGLVGTLARAVAVFT